MLPSSVAMAVPERPATMMAVVSGASSRSDRGDDDPPDHLAGKLTRP